MIQNKLARAFLLLLVIQACQPNSSTPLQIEGQKAFSDSLTASTPLEKIAATNPFPISSQATFRLDTASLGRFQYSWYLFAFGEEYRWFQRDAVQFPFQSTFQDSLGNVHQSLFQSVDSMVAWRLEHPDFFDKEHHNIDRVVAEGYPYATFDSISSGHFEHIPSTDSILLTYITPFFKSDYYFRKEKGCWIVFKSSHFHYSSLAIKNLTGNKFEDFLLRFYADLPYYLQHTKFPLKDLDTNGDGETEHITYRTRQQEEQSARGQSGDYFRYMTIYPNFSKNRQELSDMYLTVKHEGCACGWSHFRKTGTSWMLVETLNCSG